MDHSGQKTRLSTLWQDKTLVLIFVRHLGCPLCRAHVIQMKEAYPDYQAAGAEVVIVAMGTVQEVADFRVRYALPFRFLADPERVAYRAFDLPRGGIGSVAGPSMWSRGWKALLSFGAGKVKSDPYQLPGSFVIDRAGIIRFAHYAKNSSDWASNEEHLAAIGG